MHFVIEIAFGPLEGKSGGFGLWTDSKFVCHILPHRIRSQCWITEYELCEASMDHLKPRPMTNICFNGRVGKCASQGG